MDKHMLSLGCSPPMAHRVPYAFLRPRLPVSGRSRQADPRHIYRLEDLGSGLSRSRGQSEYLLGHHRFDDEFQPREVTDIRTGEFACEIAGRRQAFPRAEGLLADDARP